MGSKLHPKAREEVIHYLQANPGKSFSDGDIARALLMARGTVAGVGRAVAQANIGIRRPMEGWLIYDPPGVNGRPLVAEPVPVPPPPPPPVPFTIRISPDHAAWVAERATTMGLPRMVFLARFVEYAIDEERTKPDDAPGMGGGEGDDETPS